MKPLQLFFSSDTIDPIDMRSGGGQNGKIPLLIKGGRDALYSMR